MERQFRKYNWSNTYRKYIHPSKISTYYTYSVQIENADDNLIVRGSTRMYNSIATQYTYLSFLLSYLKIIEECYVNALVLE